MSRGRADRREAGLRLTHTPLPHGLSAAGARETIP